MAEDNKQANPAGKDFLSSSIFLSEIIDYLPDATMAISKDGEVIIWNQAMEQMTGAKAADMIGKNNYEYAVPFYNERRPILIDLALTPQDTSIEEKYPYVKREGDILVTEIFVPTFKENGSWLWAKAKPLCDASGQVVGSIEIVRDVTEHHKSEEALKQHAKKLEKMNDIMVGRELKMVELKKELEALQKKIQSATK